MSNGCPKLLVRKVPTRRYQVKTPELVVDFDRTQNGKYECVRCGDCNGPLLGHRAEKCRKNNGYDDAVVRKYETSMRSSVNKKEFEYLNGYKEETRVGLQAGQRIRVS